MRELKTSMLAVRLRPSTHQELRSKAAAAGMTMADVINLLIEQSDGILPPRVVAKRTARGTTQERGEYVTLHGG